MSIEEIADVISDIIIDIDGAESLTDGEIEAVSDILSDYGY